MTSAKRAYVVAVGLFVSAASAALSSFESLKALAVACGWTTMFAPMLPLTIDSLAMTATTLWLARSTASRRLRRVARNSALVAIGASLAGNAAYHAMAAGLIHPNWIVVVTVGAVPAIFLGLTTHLASLRTDVDDIQSEPAVPGGAQLAVPSTIPAPGVPSPVRTEVELLVAAQAADAAWQATYGRKISRDALRRELRIGASRATALLRQLRAEVK